MGDRFVPEMHLRQCGTTCSPCGTFKKTKEEYKSLKKEKIPDIFVKKN